MALWFPRLPVERLLRTRLGPSWLCAAAPEEGTRPLVVAASEGNVQRLVCLDAGAAALGLRRGMGLADARAMHPHLEVVEAEPGADRRLLDAVADWCDRYTPLVASCGEDGLFLDITGCAHLFGGEAAMLADVPARLARQGISAAAGLASTPGMAWAAARFGDGAPVAVGGEAAALAPMPLAALRLEPVVVAGLEGVGLRDVGAVMAAPRAPLARRFGAALLLRLDRALGRLDEPVSPRLPVPPFSVERHLAEPVVLVEQVERLVFLLARALKDDLERRGEGARRLRLSLFRVDGAVQRFHVGASRPLRDPDLVLRLFRERLGRSTIEADCGFELVRLSALLSDRLASEQGDLAGSQTGDERDFAHFVDRVRARLGGAALVAPVLVESHLPERAVAHLPSPAQAGADALAGKPVPERPIRLFSPPEPIEVTAAQVPEGPPTGFRWRRVLYPVARAEGPERIAPEWWREDAPTRDYFRVEDGEGRRYWLFRQGLYGASPAMPRWFLHGLFA